MTTPRHVRAREWRDQIGISRADLAERIGYPVRSIQEFEAGVRSGNDRDGRKTTPISEAHWLRYAMACAAFENNLKLPF